MTARLEDRLASLVALRYPDDHEEARQVLDSTLRRLAWRRRRGYKVCSSCHERKPVAAFGRDIGRPDGLRHRCALCERRRTAQRRLGLIP